MNVFTDGGAYNNGKTNCKAGVGVYIPDMNIELSEKLLERPTNQRAELTGIKRALEITTGDLLIYSDSMYSINCVTKWYKNWEKNNWLNSKKQPVKNQEIVKDILNLMTDRNIEYKHVRSHQSQPNKNTVEYKIWYGNDIADKLASKSIEVRKLCLD